MTNPIIVTSYVNADIDGVAGMMGYAEFLRHQGQDAIAALQGQPNQEARFILDFFNIAPLPDMNRVVSKEHDVILVDASHPDDIPDQVDPKQIIEVIDHRTMHKADEFPNAKQRIELVGAAATLVTESWYNIGARPSHDTAALLYAAIVSHTINFKSSVTTPRDRKMASWLLEKLDIPHNFIHTVFRAKSVITSPLRDVFNEDFSSYSFSGSSVGIAQLEILNAEKFITDHREEIANVLFELKGARMLKSIFFSCIDLERGETFFVIIDDETQHMIEHVLQVQFFHGVGKRDEILFRKQIWPLLSQHLRK